jgi:predicted protein tyrosine phosphatase
MQQYCGTRHEKGMNAMVIAILRRQHHILIYQQFAACLKKSFIVSVKTIDKFSFCKEFVRRK